jgi:hypothetical protein
MAREFSGEHHLVILRRGRPVTCEVKGGNKHAPADLLCRIHVWNIVNNKIARRTDRDIVACFAQSKQIGAKTYL